MPSRASSNQSILDGLFFWAKEGTVANRKIEIRSVLTNNFISHWGLISQAFRLLFLEVPHSNISINFQPIGKKSKNCVRTRNLLLPLKPVNVRL
jgi:hypothetical protein